MVRKNRVSIIQVLQGKTTDYDKLDMRSYEETMLGTINQSCFAKNCFVEKNLIVAKMDMI